MTRFNRLLLLTVLLLAPAGSAAAQFGSGGAAEKASISLAWREAPGRGGTATLGVVVEIEPGWHVQAGEGSGDEQPPYLASTLTLTLPDGWTAGETKWPAAHIFELGVGKYAEKLAGYEDRIVLAVPIDIPADAGDGPHQISAVLGYQACDDNVCIMPTDTQARMSVTLGVTEAAGADLAALFSATLGGADDAPAAASAAGFGPGDRVHTEVVWYEDRLEPGASVSLGVVFDVQPNWHIQAGVGVDEDFIAATIDVTLPDGWSVSGPIIWPTSHKFTLGEGEFAETLVGYEGRSLAVVPIAIPADATPGDYSVSAKVGYQACDDSVCEMPTDKVAGTDATVVATGASIVPRRRDRSVLALFEQTLGLTPNAGGDAGGAALTLAGVLGLLFGALVGGFLLNLTPCVLPVIPLKIMSLAHTAGTRQRTFSLGIVMCLGVVAFWLALGIAIVSISEFTALNQLYQKPLFSIGVGVVIAVLAIGMCGLFLIQLPQFIYRVSPSHDSVVGSFGFGIMTAVLSTPCTAPFMGAAVGAALGQGTALVLTVFATIGLGMASPYFVLAAFPQLVDRLPRTGPGSELVKQVMGLLMLSAASFFIGVGLSGMLVTPPEPPSRMYWWPVFGFVALAALWMAYRTMQITPSITLRRIFVPLGIIGVALSLFSAFRFSRQDKTIDWVYYTPIALQQALDDGNAVVLEFTAEWCINCKVLERTVLNSRDIAGRLAEDDVVPMKVDLTGDNIVGNDKLQETGGVAIPWLVIYTPAGDAVFAHYYYSPETLLEAIEGATATAVAKK